MANAAAEIKRNLSLENSDRATSASSRRVKLSMMFLTRNVISLENGADWNDDVNLVRTESDENN